MTADGFGKFCGTLFVAFETGDKVTNLALDLIAFPNLPLAGDLHKLASTGEGTDVLINIYPCQKSALGSTVVFFPSTYPLVGGVCREFVLCQFMESRLIAFEPKKVVASVGDDG